MNEDRSPGVGPVTWATLGLLVLSWALLASEIVRAFWRPVVFRDSAVWFVLLALGAHVICGLTAWRGRHDLVMGVLPLLLSLVYAGISAVGFLLIFYPATARRLGLESPSLVPAVYYAWGLAWVFGPVLMWVARTPRGGSRSGSEGA